MSTTDRAEVVFRGEYRPRGSSQWRTYFERPSESSAWDELLTAEDLTGHDLRVTRVERRDPATT